MTRKEMLSLSGLLLLAAASVLARVPEEVRTMLRPWHDFQDTWIERAAVIVTGRLGTGEYPCIERESGELDMIQRDYFKVMRVLRGRVAVEYLDVDLHSEADAERPPYFVEDRMYLLLLKPTTESQKLLEDAKTIYGLGNRLAAGEVIAILDLSQSEIEATANKTRATRSGKRGDFRFSPRAWKALRDAGKVDFALQDRFLAFMQEVVLVKNASRADVRSWLGPPDCEHRWKGGLHENDWYLNLKAYRKPADGAIYTQLQVNFAPDGRIASFAVDHLKWTVRPELKSSAYMQAAELKKAGLKRVKREFGP